MIEGLIRLAGDCLGEVEAVEALGDFHHCRAFRVRNGQGSFILKNIESEHLSGISDFNERLEVATEIAQQMQEYYTLLSQVGLPVPHDYHVKVVAEPEDKVLVIEVATDCGPDLTSLLTAASNGAEKLIQGILTVLRPVVFREDIGIDPYPANFAQNTELSFVDFFPARHGGLVGFPQPQEEEVVKHCIGRYYTPFGKLRLLRFNLRRISPHLQDIFYQQLQSSYPEGQAFLSRFQDLLVERVKELLTQRRYPEVREQIEGLGPFEIDDLREIAAEVIPDRATLNRLFELTHIDFRRSQAEREARLSQFKEQLISILLTNR